MGETRVDLQHLLEDLRDAYPGALEETILTEVVANSLDSGATCLRLTADPASSTLTIVDDGSGMRRRDLVRYHDLAASTKTRGHGIGFAGVGIKLGLLVCEDVVTETRRGKEYVASRWHLAGRHKAPWKWVPPLGLVAEHGTAVQLKLHNALSPLLDKGYIEGSLRRQYQPLLEPEFDEMLAAYYPKGFRFEVNGRILERRQAQGAEVSKLAVCLARKRKPAAVGYLLRSEVPFPEDQRGLAISTFGKVIKRGWDWLGITPTAPDRMTGMIEAPALAEALTLNKETSSESAQGAGCTLGIARPSKKRSRSSWPVGEIFGNPETEPVVGQCGRWSVIWKRFWWIWLKSFRCWLRWLSGEPAGKALPLGQATSAAEDGHAVFAMSVMTDAEVAEEAGIPRKRYKTQSKSNCRLKSRQESRNLNRNPHPVSPLCLEAKDGPGRVVTGLPSGSSHTREIRTSGA